MNKLNLRENLIHLWYIPLDKVFFSSELGLVLAKEELQKAQNFYFENLRVNYIIKRNALRWILSKYCNVAPQDIVIQYTGDQKPFIATNIVNIQFNMSDSHKMAVVAVTQNCCIGLDIEFVVPITNIYSIVQHFFSEKEFNKFAKLQTKQQLEAFYTLWTRKEAFVKAIGTGLAFPLNKFSVNFLPDEPLELIEITDSLEQVSNWTLQAFNFDYLHDPYIIAIFTKSSVKEIVIFNYQEVFVN